MKVWGFYKGSGRSGIGQKFAGLWRTSVRNIELDTGRQTIGSAVRVEIDPGGILRAMRSTGWLGFSKATASDRA